RRNLQHRLSAGWHRWPERARSACHRHILAGNAPGRHRTPPAAVLTAGAAELRRHQLASRHRRHAPEAALTRPIPRIPAGPPLAVHRPGWPPGAVAGDTGGVRLLERKSSLASLAAYAQEARRGDGRLVLVAGEAGVGKSALVEQFRCEFPDAHWSWGACDGLFTPRPLGPLFDLAERL